MREGASRSDRTLALAVLVLGLAVALVAAMLTRSSVEDRRQQEFTNRAEATRAAISRRTGAYNEVLYGLRGVLRAAPEADGAQVVAAIKELDLSRRLPGARAIAWAPRVMTAEDAAGFARRSLGGAPIEDPSPRGRESYPVAAIDPVAGNEAVLGFDLAGEAVRRAALFSARDSGDPVATAPIDLVGGGRGFLVFLAVYEAGSNPVTAPARRRNIVGVVVAAFTAEQMLSEVLGHPRAVEVEIHDVGLSVGRGPVSLSDRSLLYDSTDRGLATASRSLPPPSQVLDLNVADRRWRLFAYAGPAFPRGLDRWVPVGVGLGTALFSVLAAGLVLALARPRRLAEALAAEMTVSLRERERDLRASNEALTEANRELVALNQNMTDFVAVASHELRTPLAALIGASDLLAQTASDDETRHLSDIVGRHSNVLSRLVGDLLTVSRLDAGTVPSHPEAVTIANVVEAAAADLGLSEVEIGGDRHAQAWVDPDHARRMLTNFLANADRYGSPPLEVKVHSSDGTVEIEVLDRGPGPAPEVKDRLFDRFARSEKGQTGLGLSIVRGLARANGGEARFRPREGGGSAFALSLPGVRDGGRRGSEEN